MIYGIAIILEALLICRPISAAWDQSIRGSCGNEVTAYATLEICGLIIDLAIAIYPIPLVCQLDIVPRKKIGIIIIFSIGIL